MIRRLIPFVVVLALASCGKSTPTTPVASRTSAPPAVKAEATQKAVVPAPTPEAPTAAAAAVAPSPTATPEGGALSDKDKLARCYSEVYCAQKKGEMSKILDIYKSYGFETPQVFTKAWIEAAKDTDWVTKLAYEVSKKCPTPPAK